MIESVSLIGAGNLATRLGHAFKDRKIQIKQVYSRSRQSADKLAAALHTRSTDCLKSIELSSDLILISVKDDAIEQVLGQLELKDQFIVHTAGSVEMGLLAQYTSRCGVLYPLQTFSKARELDLNQIPFCLEASDERLMDELVSLARKLSDQVYSVNSQQRKQLHLAAVFCCNFVNHLYSIAGTIAENYGLPFDLLQPLILETAQKVQMMPPKEAQTGPAVRFDQTVINAQLQELKAHPKWQEIYRLISESIFEMHKNL